MNNFLNQLVGQHVLYANDAIIICWNRSATFNVYDHNFSCIDCFTSYDVETFDAAEKLAIQYVSENEL